MVSYFHNQKAKVLQKVFWLHIILFERLFYNKKKQVIALVGTFGLFFVGCFSIILPISLLISSSNFFTIIK
jgi:hypothetical protein